MADNGQRGASWFSIFQAIVSSLTVAGLCWLGNTVISYGQQLSVHSLMHANAISRIEQIEARGSIALDSHISLSNKRFDRLEESIHSLRAVESQVQVILTEIKHIREMQDRLEKRLTP